DHVAVIAVKNDGSTTTGNQAIPVPGGFSNFTLAPARMHTSSPGGPMWFVETPGSSSGDPGSPGSQITLVRMDNPFASAPTFTFTNLTVNPCLSEPMPLGGRTGLGTRMYHTALRTVGGVTHLLAEHSPGFNDGAGTHAKVQWYDIDVTNPSSVALLQQGKIDPGAGIDTYFPDAAIAADGSIGLNFSQSVPFGSTLPRPGIMDMYVTGRRPGDPTGTMRAPLVAVLGAAPLNAF